MVSILMNTIADKCITHWDSTTTKLDTQWGRITHLDWCGREVERMQRYGARVLVALRTLTAGTGPDAKISNICCIQRQ